MEGTDTETVKLHLQNSSGALAVPDIADTKICYSSHYGYQSYTNKELGSYYLHTLCHTLTYHAFEMDIDAILNETCRVLHIRRDQISPEKLQISCYENLNWNRALFLNPGQPM